MAARPRAPARRSPTLATIAARAGVSEIAVSFALRGIGRIGADTRERIRRIAKQLGYRMTSGVLIPPSVRRGTSEQALRLVMPSFPGYGLGDPAFTQRILAGMRVALAEANGDVASEPFTDPAHLAGAWRRGRWRGIVLRHLLPDAWIAELQRLGPVVYAVSQDCQAGVDSVYTNEHRSAAMVLRHLIGHGHRAIAWFGPGAPSEPAAHGGERQLHHVHSPRYAAWAALTMAARPDERLTLVLQPRAGDFSSDIAAGVERLLALTPRPTAVVAASDAAALAVLAALERHGLRVPRDLSVVGYGGGPEGGGPEGAGTGTSAGLPTLTSVALPMETVGRVVPELIQRRLADPEAIPVSLQFETTLREGASVAAPPRG